MNMKKKLKDYIDRKIFVQFFGTVASPQYGKLKSVDEEEDLIVLDSGTKMKYYRLSHITSFWLD
jgi:hypothetical protein